MSITADAPLTVLIIWNYTLSQMSRTLTKGRKGPNRTRAVHEYVQASRKPIKGVIPQIMNSSKIIELIENGLPIGELNDLQASLDIDIGKLATLLGISKATLHRRKAQGRLDAAESDRVIRYARLLGTAIAVLGSIEDAREWLKHPQFGLGGAVPLEYAKTEPGAREVERLLGRIDYGVYS